MANIAVDTAENEPSKVSSFIPTQAFRLHIDIPQREVENAANAGLEFATNMTARKNDVRSGGDKMATPGHKGGKGKEERDLDDTSSS